MKKNNKSKFNLDKDDIDKLVNKIPYPVVWLLMLFLAPIGIWFFVLKKTKDKSKLYNWSRNLTGIGVFVLFVIAVGLYSKIKEIVVLYESGMSLDMISFIPDNLYLYVIGTIIFISFIIGGKKLMNQAKIEQIYTKAVNLERETSIKKLSEKLEISMNEVKNNIKLLQKKDYLIPIEIDNKKNKIIYKDKDEHMATTKVLSNKEKKYKTVQCKKCGTLVSLKLDTYVECDFCGMGLIEENNH